MKNIYCISGLGADERIFSKLHIPGYSLKHISWLTPQKKETIGNYSKRMSLAIDEPEPILLGLSFGGMMCIEISKHIKVARIILISTVKCTDELPGWMKLAGRMKLNKIFPLRSNRFTEPIQNRNLGVETEEEKKLAREYRRNTNRPYLLWAIDQILNWKCNSVDAPLIHIHGTADRIFPVKRIKADILIPSAGHLMVFNRGEIISNKIAEIL